MNRHMGGSYYQTWVDQYGIHTGPYAYLPGPTFYAHESQFRRLSPAQAFVFIDTHPDSGAGTQFLMHDRAETLSSGGPLWATWPASYHNGGAGLGFADGHAEMKRWVVPETRQPVRYLDHYEIRHNTDSADLRDFLWLWQRATEPRNP